MVGYYKEEVGILREWRGDVKGEKVDGKVLRKERFWKRLRLSQNRVAFVRFAELELFSVNIYNAIWLEIRRKVKNPMHYSIMG